MFVFFFATSLFFVGFAGWGLFVRRIVTRLPAETGLGGWLQCYIAGLVSVFILALCGLPWTILLAIIGLGSAVALTKPIRSELSFRSLFKVDPVSLVFFGLMTALIAGLPIHDWDAKSSWFGTGKILLDQGALRVTPLWTDPVYWTFCFEYPKFFSSLVALVMTPFGAWNEWTPKIAVELFFIAAWLGFRSLEKNRLSYALLVVWVAASFHRYLWNGYMDAYLAVFAGLFWIFLWKNPDRPQRALPFLVLLPLLKTEGLILAGLCLVQFFIVAWWNRRTISSFRREGAVWGAFLLTPLLLWQGIRAVFGLKSWLIGTGRTQDLLRERLAAGFLPEIFGHLFYDGLILRGLALVIFATLALILARRRLTDEELLRLSVISFLPLVYAIPLAAAYMVTPLDAAFNLSVSQDRVVFPIRMALFVFCYVCFERIFDGRDRADI